jgi:hypothetical protein
MAEFLSWAIDGPAWAIDGRDKIYDKVGSAGPFPRAILWWVIDGAFDKIESDRWRRGQVESERRSRSQPYFPAARAASTKWLAQFAACRGGDKNPFPPRASSPSAILPRIAIARFPSYCQTRKAAEKLHS